jgi:antitoxin HigA-1
MDMLQTLNSSTTIDALDPVHPGEVLAEEFLVPKGLSAAALARHIGVPANRVSEIIAGRRAITGDTALRLAAAFGTTPEFWMGLQMRWELVLAARRGVGQIGTLPNN